MNRTIKLHSQKQADYASKLINECLDQDELWCVDIKKYKEAKTMQQLRALFGTWYSYLSETLGETKDDLHRVHKFGRHGEGGWLLKIYTENPQNDMQKMWVENRDNLIEKFNNDNQKWINKLFEHEKRLSLSWATIDQMREYMNLIEHYYMNAGYPLPILEKFKRWYT